MQKQFVTYEIAIKLKELSFDEECFGYFPNIENTDKEHMIFTDIDFKYCKNSILENEVRSDTIAAPLYQQVIDWFREEHNIDIIIKPWSGDKVGEKTYAADVFIFGTITYIKLKREGTYEEARDQAILKAIELCQKEK